MSCLAIWALESCCRGDVKADEMSDSLQGIMSRKIGVAVVTQAIGTMLR